MARGAPGSRHGRRLADIWTQYVRNPPGIPRTRGFGRSRLSRHHVLTLAQPRRSPRARAAAHRVAPGRLRRLHAASRAGQETVCARWMGALVASREHALLSHRSAAALWELIRADGRRVDVTAKGAEVARGGASRCTAVTRSTQRTSRATAASHAPPSHAPCSTTPPSAPRGSSSSPSAAQTFCASSTRGSCKRYSRAIRAAPRARRPPAARRLPRPRVHAKPFRGHAVPRPPRDACRGSPSTPSFLLSTPSTTLTSCPINYLTHQLFHPPPPPHIPHPPHSPTHLPSKTAALTPT